MINTLKRWFGFEEPKPRQVRKSRRVGYSYTFQYTLLRINQGPVLKPELVEEEMDGVLVTRVKTAHYLHEDRVITVVFSVPVDIYLMHCFYDVNRRSGEVPVSEFTTTLLRPGDDISERLVQLEVKSSHIEYYYE